MTDILGQFACLQRPELLVRTARIGAQHYRRNRHLRPLLGTSHLPRHAVALLRLGEIESEMNARRLERNASYSVTKHLEVLTAIMGEARAILCTAPEERPATDVQLNASASAALRSATKASSASLIAGSIGGC